MLERCLQLRDHFIKASRLSLMQGGDLRKRSRSPAEKLQFNDHLLEPAGFRDIQIDLGIIRIECVGIILCSQGVRAIFIACVRTIVLPDQYYVSNLYDDEIVQWIKSEAPDLRKGTQVEFQYALVPDNTLLY